MIRKRKKKTPVLSYGRTAEIGGRGGTTHRSNGHPQIHTDRNLYPPPILLIPDLAVPLDTLANTDPILAHILLDLSSIKGKVPVCAFLNRIHLLQGGGDVVWEDHSHTGDVSNRQGAISNRRVRAQDDAGEDRGPVACVSDKAECRYSYRYIYIYILLTTNRSSRTRREGGRKTYVSQATRPWLHISRVGTSTRLVCGRGRRAGRAGRRGCTRGCSRPRTFSLLRRSRGRGAAVVCRPLSRQACRRRSP